MPDIHDGANFSEYKIIGEPLSKEKGTSCVYKGENISNGTFVAIKILNKDQIPNNLDRFLEEGRILSELSHGPGIVAYRHQGNVDKHHFIIMEYVSDKSLRDIIDDAINNGRQIPLEHVVKYVQQAASALQYIHTKNFIHCDIKPEHLLLDDDGNIFLCDFGQAVRLKPTKDQVQQIPQPNSPKRNPKYMAPEQDNYHCCASDQYALGLVTCELLCGEFPDTIPPSVTDWKAQGFRSLGIAHTLETALSPKPQDRHENIQAFADALKKEIDKEIRKGTTKSTSLVINEPQPPALSPSKDTPPMQVSAAPTLPGSPQPSGPSLNLNSTTTQSNSNRAVFSRRTLFMLVDAATFGFLGVSWVELEPKVAQLFVPPVYSSPFKDFGTIYYTYYGHTENVNGASWSPDGKRIASGSFDRTIQIWNALDGSNRVILLGHTEHVNDVAWAHVGTHVASCSGVGKNGKDNTVRVWDATNGQNIFTMTGHTDVVNALTWSPDDSMIASASFDGTVIVWNAKTGKRVDTYKGHIRPVFDVAWSPNGMYIASCSTGSNPQVHIWNAMSMEDNEGTPYTGHRNDIYSISWSPDGKLIASGSRDGTVHVWSVDGTDISGSPKTFNYPVRRVSWSPKGKYIAAGTSVGDVYVWEAPVGTNIHDSPQNLYVEQNQSIFGTSVQGVNVPENSMNLNALAWSPDGTKIALGGGESSVYVWSSGLPGDV